ncbi:MAG: hypothetical protein HY343_06990, partial [Lentisphaerae bacterium]|nr:hypothetical protein [Lentisphaerota bacterium]
MTIKRLALLVLFTAVSLSGARAVETLKASSRAPTLIILPALPRVLQIAFDVAQLRNVTLVTYQIRAGKAPLLHTWNGTEWISIAEDE